jgi:hypothetical protein
MRTLVAVFLIFHGIFHLWYVTVSLRLIEYKSWMGWSGESWLLTSRLGDGAARTIAAGLYSLAAMGFVASGVGLLMEQPWFRPVLIGSVVFSLIATLLFWDGKNSTMMFVEILVLGVLIIVFT